MKFCNIFCAILLLISRVSAKEYMSVEVYTSCPSSRSIGLFIQENKDAEKKCFWACRFMGFGVKFSKSFSKFLDKIDGLTLNSSLPVYKSLKQACTEYDKLRYGNHNDLKHNTIYLFDYSPNNEYFQKIIKILQRLSNCHFKLDLLNSMTIR